MLLRRRICTIATTLGFSLLLYTCNAFECQIGQQPDPGNGNRMRWVLPYTHKERCTCTKIVFGGSNTVPFADWKNQFYTDDPLLFVNNDDVDNLKELLGCKRNKVVKETTSTKSSTPITSPDRQKEETSTTDVGQTSWKQSSVVKETTTTKSSTAMVSTTVQEEETSITDVGPTSREHPPTVVKEIISKSSTPVTVTPTLAQEDEASTTNVGHTSTEQSTACVKPLGMESGDIHNDQITASSYGRGPGNARLNKNDRWRDSISNSPWLMVSFDDKVQLSGIIIPGWSNWVTKCRFEMENYDQQEEYTANSDGNTPVTILFNAPVETRNIKVIPTECHGGSCPLRLELLGPCEE